MAEVRRRPARALTAGLLLALGLALGGAGPAGAAEEAPAAGLYDRPVLVLDPGGTRRPSTGSTPTARAGSWSPPRTTRRSGSGRPRTAGCCAPCACPPAPATSARPTPPRSRPTAPWSPPAGGRARPATDESVYLFDRASGRLLRRVGGLPNVVHHLAFSPDGTRLAATLGGGGRRAPDRPRGGPGGGGGRGLRRPQLRGRVRRRGPARDHELRRQGPALRPGAAPACARPRRRAASGPSASPSRPTAGGSRSATTTRPRSTCSTRARSSACSRPTPGAWTTATSAASPGRRTAAASTPPGGGRSAASAACAAGRRAGGARRSTCR